MPDFETLSDAAVAALAPHAIEQHCAVGTLALRRDEPANALLILLEGRLLVSVASSEGRALAFRLVTPVGMVGEIGAVDGAPRSADVVAAAPCTLLRLPRAVVLKAINDHPDLAMAMLRLLCRRLRETSRDFELVATQRLEMRLATLLMRLAESTGEARADGALLLPPRLSQSDLSMLVAATREAVNKQLAAWREAGIIALEAGRLVVLRMEALSALETANSVPWPE